MTTPATNPTTPASAPVSETKPANVTPAKTEATPAPTKDAAAISPAKSARMKLDEITAARKKLAEETAAATKAKADLEPMTAKAKAFDEKLAKLAEDPAALLEEFGIDRNAVTEKLAAKAIEDVRAKTPDGRIDALQAEIKGLKDAEAKAKADAAAAAQAKSIKDYQATLVAGIDAEKFPLTAKAAKAEFGDDLPGYLWEVGRRIYLARAAGKTPAEVEAIAAPTPAEVLAEVEKRYAGIAAGLATPAAAPAVAAAKDKDPETLKAEAEERAKAKAKANGKTPAPPLGAFTKPATTIAERRAAARAKK